MYNRWNDINPTKVRNNWYTINFFIFFNIVIIKLAFLYCSLYRYHSYFHFLHPTIQIAISCPLLFTVAFKSQRVINFRETTISVEVVWRAKEKSSMLLSQYLKNEQMNSLSFWGNQYHFRKLYILYIPCMYFKTKAKDIFQFTLFL